MNSTRKILASAIGIALLAGASATAGAADVGVSVSIAQPGFYGQFSFGDAGPMIYAQPVMVVPAAPVVYVRDRWHRVHAREYGRDRDDFRGDDHEYARADWHDEGWHGRGHGRGRGHDRDDD